MNRRPISIAIIGWLFVGVGCVSLVAGVEKFIRPVARTTTQVSGDQHAMDLAFVTVSALMALLGGAYVLRGCGWARWLLVVWLALHVVLSYHHSLSELLVHGVLFWVVVFFLFRKAARDFSAGSV